VRQLLADQVSGSLVGLWLLVPEHLRLGTWDLLGAWTGQADERVEPRLALQLIHEAALCLAELRHQRCLTHKGFELVNTLPFLASDRSIHHLLNAHTVAQAQNLQSALGKLCRSSGHFAGRLLAIDPHRVRSYSKRRLRCHQQAAGSKPVKVAQTFWVLDADTYQPVCWQFNALLATRDRDEVAALANDYPQRWHIEAFFNAHQDLGWQRAGTMNLHIRYGQMSMALIAQTILDQLRQRLGQPYAGWDAKLLAQDYCVVWAGTCA
jgi:hypothetical protein